MMSEANQCLFMALISVKHSDYLKNSAICISASIILLPSVGYENG